MTTTSTINEHRVRVMTHKYALKWVKFFPYWTSKLRFMYTKRKQTWKRIYFFDLYHGQMLTLSWIHYEAIQKRCGFHFRFRTNVNEPLNDVDIQCRTWMCLQWVVGQGAVWVGRPVSGHCSHPGHTDAAPNRQLHLSSLPRSTSQSGIALITTARNEVGAR